MPVNLRAPEAKDIFPVRGVTLGTAMAGVRKANRKDLTVVSDRRRRCGRRRFHAEPLLRRAGAGLPRSPAEGLRHLRAMLVNTGNANAGTGEDGLAGTRATCIRWRAS